MDQALIGMGIFLGIVFGIGGAFLLILFKKKLDKKHIVENIRKQDAKFGDGGVPINFFKKPKEEVEKKEEIKEKKVDKKKPKKVEKKKMKKVRVKKTGKGKK